MGRDLNEVVKGREARFHVAGSVAVTAFFAFFVLRDWWTVETVRGQETAPDVAVSRSILAGVLVVCVVTVVAVMAGSFFETWMSLVVAGLVAVAAIAQVVLLVVSVSSEVVHARTAQSGLMFGAVFCLLSVFAVMRRRAYVRK